MHNSSHPAPNELPQNKPLPIWKHPYTLYTAITLVLFLFLVLMGWLALENDWLPNRGFK